MKSVFSKKTSQVHLQRNAFDLSHSDVFSIAPGMLLPIHVSEVNPNEHFVISPANYVRTMPLNSAAFTRLKQHIEFYFVPMRTLMRQFNQAIDELTAQGMKGLIIDLRDNPGGLVNSATAILDRILSKDQLLVYTVDKNGKKQEEYTEDDETINVPISVLINGNSASASEIVSGCLQDYGKAKLVGTTSFGKGIVQYVLPLGDGSAIKLTSAKYYTPNGRNIHGTGIDPDVEVELNSDSETDTQLEKAQEIVLQEIQAE